MKKRKTKGTQWQRILRSCLSFALILALALGNIVPISVAKAEGEGKSSAVGGTNTADWMNLDFNGEFENWSYINYPNGAPEFVSQVDDPTSDDENEKCIKIVYDDTNKKYQQIMFPRNEKVIDYATQKKVVYEYKAMLPTEQASKEVVLIASTVNWPYFYSKGGAIKPDGKDQEYGNLSTGSWTKIAMAIDYENGNYKFYVNDVCKEEGDFKKADHKFMRITVNKTGYILIDDVRVYEDTKTQFALDSSATTTTAAGHIPIITRARLRSSRRRQLRASRAPRRA